MEIILINKASGVNLRTMPNVGSEKIASISKNEKVKFLSFDATKQWVNIERSNGVKGWSVFKYFLVKDAGGNLMNDPVWLDIAYGEYGITEFAGLPSNPRIEEYINSCNVRKGLKDDTAWCSAFTNWCMEKAGYEGTNSLWAQDWSKWGQKIETPFRGCIAVFKRYTLNSDTGKIEEKGHVGFYLNKNGEENIDLLSGNASNQVIVKSFPTKPSEPPKSGEYKLIGYRRPLS